jgi:hypothetical protein
MVFWFIISFNLCQFCRKTAATIFRVKFHIEFSMFAMYCRFSPMGQVKFRGSRQLYIRGTDLIFVPAPLNPRPFTRLGFSYHGNSHATCQDGLFPTCLLHTSKFYSETDYTCIFLCYASKLLLLLLL